MTLKSGWINRGTSRDTRHPATISIDLTEPFVLITVGTKERGLIEYDHSVRILLKEAQERGQEPLLRYGDGTPATYLGVAKPGAIADEELAILVMPTKRKGEE